MLPALNLGALRGLPEARAFHETFVPIGAITACAVLAAWRRGAAAPRAPATDS